MPGGGGSTFSQTRPVTANTAHGQQALLVLPKAPSTRKFSRIESSQSERPQAAGLFKSGHQPRYLSQYAYFRATIAPSGGVHIFAWPASFRKFAPRACIFSHTIPVCVQRRVLFSLRSASRTVTSQRWTSRVQAPAVQRLQNHAYSTSLACLHEAHAFTFHITPRS